MNEEFLNTLSPVNKLLYKTAFTFHMKHHVGATHEASHIAGLEKLESIGVLMEELSKPQLYVDLETGKKFYAIEQ